MLVQQQNKKSLQAHQQQLKKKHLKRYTQDYQFPARLTVAEHQQAAKRIGAIPENYSQTKQEVCECCQLPFQKQDIQLCTYLFQNASLSNESTHSQYSNSNVSILFHILKAMIAFCLFRILLTEIFKSVLVGKSKYCSEQENNCKILSFTDYLAFPYTIYDNPQLLQIQISVNSLSILVSILLFMVYRYFLFQHFDFISSQNYYQDEYSIFVENVSYLSLMQAQLADDNKSSVMAASESKQPSLEDLFLDRADIPNTSNVEALIKSSLQLYFIGLATKIKRRLQRKSNQSNSMRQIQSRLHNKLKNIDNESLRQKLVKEIVLCYDFTEVERLEEFIQNTMLEIEDNKEDLKYFDSKSLNYNPNRVKFLSEKLQQLQANYSQNISADLFLSRFLGCAIVTFQFSQFKDYLLDFHQKNLRVFYDDITFLSLKESDVPEKTNWSLLNLSTLGSLKTQVQKFLIIAFILTLLLLLTTLIKFCFLNSFTIVSSARQSQTYQMRYLILASLVTFILYNLMNKIVEKAVKTQGNASFSSFRISRLVKGSIITFLFLLTTAQIFTQAFKRGLNISKNNSLNITLFFAFFLSFQTIYHLLPISYIWVLIKRNQYSSQEVISKFQIRLNHQLGLDQFDVVQILIFQIVTFFFASFFSNVAPFNAFTYVFFLMVNYWIFRISLIKFYSIPDRITLRLVQIFMHLLEFQVIVLALGYYLSISQLEPSLLENKSTNLFNFSMSVQLCTILQLAIAVIYKVIALVWPRRVYINRYKNSLSFSQTYQRFPFFYGIQSPAAKFTFQKFGTSRHQIWTGEALEQNQVQKNKSQQQVIDNIDVSRKYSKSKKKGNLPPKNPKNSSK